MTKSFWFTMQRLTWLALRYTGAPQGLPQRISRVENLQGLELGKILSTDKYKDRVDTLLLVATLVVTAGPAEWVSKRCDRLRPQVKNRPPNFNQ